MTDGPVTLLLGTRKGAFLLASDAAREHWRLSEPILLGHMVHHLAIDPRDRRTIVLAARTGHLGPTIFRSDDRGRSWQEATRPPAFEKAPSGEAGLVVDHVFWVTPGHASEPGVWWAATSPQGLFRSEDGGRTWDGVRGFNDHPMREAWCAPGGGAGTPDGSTMHSILVDPRDARHMYIAMSDGGVFETTDQGRDWRPLNQGCAADFIPGPPPEYGHDPHCVVLHPARPDRLYQQNHCGIYRMERPEGRWIRIGDNMPRDVGDIGFPIVPHPRDPDTAWVFPMDGTDVWPRTSPSGRPAVYVTHDAGATWRREDRGLPPAQAWLTVLRQAMAADAHDPVGLYFGTTSGGVWASRDEGASWRCVTEHLQRIFSVEVA